MTEKIIQILFNTVDEMNAQNPSDQQIEKSLDTVLLGPSSKLDSLGLVNFIITAEQNVEEVFEISLTLANERAISYKNSPFKTKSNENKKT